MTQILINLLLAAVVLMPSQTPHASEARDSAPPCELSSMEGAQPFDLGDLRGKVLYVDFWASWCLPCAKAFPFMNQLDRDFKDQGLQIVAVNLDEVREEAEHFLARHPASFVVATDPQFQCAKGFDVQAMPSSYLVDRAGLIRHVHLGFRSGDAEGIRRLVEELLTPRPNER